MAERNKGSNIKKLPRAIADDISKPDKVAAPRSTLEILKDMLNQFKRKAEEASQQNKERVEEISGCIEDSIKDRKAKLASGLKALAKRLSKMTPRHKQF